MLISIPSRLSTPVTVSYTHLDVYKRQVYASGIGGGALIVDKYPRQEEKRPVVEKTSATQKKGQKTGQRRPAANAIEKSLN